MDEKIIGPILSEAEFYSLLDDSIPTFSEAIKAAERGALDEAKRLFAKQVREGGYKEFFFENRDAISSHRVAVNKDTILQKAQKVLDGVLTSVGISHKFEGEIDWFFNPTYNGYKEWTWQLSRHHDINTLAKSFELTGEGKYAEGVVKLLTSWIKQAVRPEPDVGDGATFCWRTIECGERMSIWPDLFFPILDTPYATDDFVLDFCRSLYEHGDRLIKSKTHNNWRNIELSGFANLAVVFPFFKVTKAWAEHVADGVYRHLVRQIHPDGFQFELTTTYHTVVLKESIHGARVLELAGYKMPRDFDEIIVKMYEIFPLLAQSGAIIPCINDGRQGKVTAFLPRDNNRWTSPLIEWGQSSCGDVGAPETNTLHTFEYAGIVTMRDKWANSRLSVFFDAGKLGRSHQHEDKLNVLIYSEGREIVAEGHSYAYDTSDMRKYVLSSFAHNTVTVDGLGQNRKPHYKWDDSMLNEKEDIVTFSSDALDYAVGKYDESYGDGDVVTDVVHKREVALLKRPKTGYGAVIVVDTLSGQSEHSYQAMWHLDIDKDAEILNSTVSLDEVSIAFGGDVGKLSVIKGQTEPHVQGFVCRSTIQGDYNAVPTVLNTKVAKDARMLTVFAFGAKIVSASIDGINVNLSYQNGESETILLP